jgi:hypothetical protein
MVKILVNMVKVSELKGWVVLIQTDFLSLLDVTENFFCALSLINSPPELPLVGTEGPRKIDFDAFFNVQIPIRPVGASTGSVVNTGKRILILETRRY